MGNQLTTEKLKRIDSNEPLPYEIEPEVNAEDIETNAEEVTPASSEPQAVNPPKTEESSVQDDGEEGQITLDL